MPPFLSCPLPVTKPRTQMWNTSVNGRKLVLAQRASNTAEPLHSTSWVLHDFERCEESNTFYLPQRATLTEPFAGVLPLSQRRAVFCTRPLHLRRGMDWIRLQNSRVRGEPPPISVCGSSRYKDGFMIIRQARTSSRCPYLTVHGH